MRDKKLDIYRGLIMMYVVGVIHTLFWFPVSNHVLKSLFLFEMAVVFFITGASYSLSSKKSYIKYLISRVPRVIVPYLIFGLFVIFIQYIAYILGTSITDSPINIFVYDTLHPLKKPGIFIPFITWHLWFMPVYLLLVPFIPPMFKLFESLKGIFKFIPLLFIAILVLYFENTTLNIDFKSVIFYAFWIYTGFFYTKFKDVNISVVKNIAISSILFIALVLIVKGDRYVLNMSTNKFPPNFTFLVFTMTAFSFLYMFRKVILKFGDLPYIRNIVDIYSAYGFTLYLYQPFTYLLLQPIYLYLFNLTGYNFILRCVLTLINIVAVILINIIFAKTFGRFENFKLKFNSSNIDMKNNMDMKKAS
ncbi:acyltransferase family protein [Romboutsia sp. 1001285H_161024_C4]|uniref:acyltransferase family protein n=1 Tax=Romboutsia sp. 1001285H_161024_C4 TaxID=2787109 RepID=UPI00189BAF41|nr:acyltransferase family protein [Romboutsia sp. 1001285H_161024_C4]